MEKALTPDERIRRAEERYYRKKIQASYRGETRVGVTEKPSRTILKKMVIQLAICVLIYGSFHLMQVANYTFSEDVINRTRYMLSYNMDFENLYNQMREHINGLLILGGEDEEEEDDEEAEAEDIYPPYIDTYEEGELEIGIGGVLIDATQDINNLSQMELDAREILMSHSLELPLRGTITSRFGYRIPTAPNVSRFHTGIDIAANIGTVVVASMDGKVVLASEGRRLSETI